MRVLITADTVGGVWTYTRELVTGLVRRGVEVTLVSFGRAPSAAQSAWLRQLPSVEYFPTSFRLEWMPDAERDLDASARYLEAVIRKCKPDLLHVSQFCYGSLDVDLPKVVVAHSDVFSWNQAVYGSLPVGKWAEWYYQVVSTGLAGASLVVAPSQWILDEIVDYYGAMRPSQVIYNGRTPELFDRLQPKQLFAANAGRLWDDGKQSRLLMQMGQPPLPVVVAGARVLEEGEGAQNLNSIESWPPESQAPAEPSVYLTGELPHDALRELLGRAAIYVATSKYEPFGLAPLEAVFSGCALVANDIPSLREIWGPAAVYFRKDDAVSLREALVMLQGNSDLRARCAQQAYEHACRRYTAARMVDDYLRVYEALLKHDVRAA